MSIKRKHYKSLEPGDVVQADLYRLYTETRHVFLVEQHHNTDTMHLTIVKINDRLFSDSVHVFFYNSKWLVIETAEFGEIELHLDLPFEHVDVIES